ncbi:MAG: hypothetical protein GX657_07590, partial [Chloroflexi bacterium]|nr:hypothetical protein [Chloroflexota bacterium]
MRTRTSAICESFIEAGWLLALVVVPLYFNVYSSRVFEPDKIVILRSLATLMAVAGLVRYAHERLQRPADASDGQPGPAFGWRSPAVGWRSPLVLPALALAAVYVLATALSVVPRVSLWGSYQRLQGTYTTFAYLVIFGLLLVHLRRREQLERLLMALVLASLPVSLYGLLQHYRLDPLPWGGDTTFRVASTMGNPIFVAAYLIMVVPLTIARLAQQIARAVQGAGARERALVGAVVGLALAAQVFAWALLGLTWGVLVALVTSAALAVTAALLRRPPAALLYIAAYVLILGAQVVCVFFTQSRG